MSPVLEQDPNTVRPQHGPQAPAHQPSAQPTTNNSPIDGALDLAFAFHPEEPAKGSKGAHARPQTPQEFNADYERRMGQVNHGFIATITNWWSGGKRDAANEAFAQWRQEYQQDLQRGLLNDPQARERLAERSEALEKALHVIENRKKATEFGVKALAVTGLTVAATLLAAPVVSGVLINAGMAAALTSAGMAPIVAAGVTSATGAILTAGVASFASRAGMGYLLGGFKYTGKQALEDLKMAAVDGVFMGGSAVAANLAVGQAVKIFGQTVSNPLLGNAIGRFSVAVAEGAVAGGVGAGAQTAFLTAFNSETWRNGVGNGLRTIWENSSAATRAGAMFGAAGGAIAGLGRLKAPKTEIAPEVPAEVAPEAKPAAATQEVAPAAPQATPGKPEIVANAPQSEIPTAPTVKVDPAATEEQLAPTTRLLNAQAHASEAIADIARPMDPIAASHLDDEAVRLRSLSEILEGPNAQPTRLVPKFDIDAQGAQLENTLARYGSHGERIEYLERVVAGNRDPLRIEYLKSQYPQQYLDNHEAFTQLCEQRLAALRALNPFSTPIQPNQSVSAEPVAIEPVLAEAVVEPAPSLSGSPESRLAALDSEIQGLRSQLYSDTGPSVAEGGADQIRVLDQNLRALENQKAQLLQEWRVGSGVLSPEEQLVNAREQLARTTSNLSNADGFDEISRLARLERIHREQVLRLEELTVSQTPQAKPTNGVAGDGLNANSGELGGLADMGEGFDGFGGSRLDVRPSGSSRVPSGPGSGGSPAARQVANGLTSTPDAPNASSTILQRNGGLAPANGEGPTALFGQGDTNSNLKLADAPESATAVMDMPEIEPSLSGQVDDLSLGTVDDLISGSRVASENGASRIQRTSVRSYEPEQLPRFGTPSGGEPEYMRQLAPEPAARRQVAVDDRPEWGSEWKKILAETERRTGLERDARLQALFDAPAPQAEVTAAEAVQPQAAPSETSQPVSVAAEPELAQATETPTVTEAATVAAPEAATAPKATASAAKPDEAQATDTEVEVRTSQQAKLQRVNELAQELATTQTKPRRSWDSTSHDFENPELQRQKPNVNIDEALRKVKALAIRGERRSKLVEGRVHGNMARSGKVVQLERPDGTVESTVAPDDAIQEAEGAATAFSDEGLIVDVADEA